MRLTLRTLLAYLDDTLDANQARTIGQKVAESPVAQELVERLRKVTRRRSLASPPLQGDTSRLDPNTVSEYLDSTLDSEELSQVEQTCLDDDVYLAEVAACHQILTLLLSEPARVPPTARQRMYRLVRGRESIPYRRPPAMPVAAMMGNVDGERSFNSSRLIAYFVGTVVLATGLVASLMLAWPRHKPTRSPRPLELVGRPTTPPPPTNIPNEPAPAGPESPDIKKPAEPSAPQPANAANTPMPMPMPMPMPTPKPELPVAPAPPAAARRPINEVPILEPNLDRRNLGELVGEKSALIERQPGAEAIWSTLRNRDAISSGKWLLSLPGMQHEIQLQSGAMMKMWGNLLEFIPIAVLECQMMVHVPPTGLDADLTLDHGRLVLTNPTPKPLVIRLRFHGEIWDLTLPSGTEVLLDGLVSLPPGHKFTKDDRGEKPMAELFLGVPKGNVSVKIRDLPPIELAAPPGPAILGWDNKNRLKEPLRIREPLPQWKDGATADSPAKDAASALRKLVETAASRLAAKGAVAELILTELANEEDPYAQTYAAYALAAVDLINPLVDSLDDLLKPSMRGSSVFALRHWISRQPENAGKLHALLQQKDYSEFQADVMLQLLHTFSDEDISKAATYEFLFNQLDDMLLGVRELAFWHLAQLDPDGAKESRYTPVADNRPAAINRWRKRLADGKLPPKATRPATPPMK